MNSPYLNRPTRQWADANLDFVANTVLLATAIRTALEGAESLAKQIEDRTNGASKERADDLLTFINDGIADYLKPLEDALQEDYDEAEREGERAL